MERIVYLLGAGFSAPLGLPTVGNFYFRSQEMYSTDANRYAHFAEVFSTIRTLSVAKNYYSANLFNIEEILSILEMTEQLNGRRLKDAFVRYVTDVIRDNTPAMVPCEAGKMPGNWEDWLFGTGSLSRLYGAFAMSLFGTEFQYAAGSSPSRSHNDIAVKRGGLERAVYSVVTLNYDTVLESVADFVANNYSVVEKPEFQRVPVPESNDKPISRVGLAKLHGCVTSGEIVPPTWNKRLDRTILGDWKLAFSALASATQIRVVGYSMPRSDAYLKYLLKAAVAEAPSLKRIDVVCLDPDGSVKSRYDEFIEFGYYAFHSRDTIEYLQCIDDVYRKNPFQPGTKSVLFDRLELAHSNFLRG